VHANCPFTLTEKSVADFVYSEDALLDDHEKELQEQGYFEDE
jgi:hypothetical protein